MQGAQSYLLTGDLVYGYNSPIQPFINGGDFWSGADFDLSLLVTPVLLDNQPALLDTTVGLYTGSLKPDDVCKLRTLNGEAYINKLQRFWNGTGSVPIAQQPADALT